MADLEFYKTQLAKLTDFITEQIHPWYGPCDGLSNGQCSECLKVLGELKEAHRLKEQLGVPHPVLTESTQYHKGMMVLPQILCEVAEVDWGGEETRVHLKERIIGLDFWIDAAQCRHGLPLSEVERTSALSGDSVDTQSQSGVLT